MAVATRLNETFRWKSSSGTFGIDRVAGAIIIAAGLMFIARTFDPQIHAFDVQTEKEPWKAQLLASEKPAPMTYSVNGKQYQVIFAGGHPTITEESTNDAPVAFLYRISYARPPRNVTVYRVRKSPLRRKVAASIKS